MTTMLTALETFGGPSRKVNPKEIPTALFISECAKRLKQSAKFELPKWVDNVKTAASRELAPYDQDWLFIRAASILRKLFLTPDVGVWGMRKKYSKKGRRGTKPSHRALAGGKVIRHCIQQLENMGYVEQHAERTGRRLSQEGVKLLHRVTSEAGSRD
eukprot:CAMPEP_0113847630 /NCGR_PEP_ID=MMETSP0372-20130328/1990_1 /TAXON_ID=340204 /ORGANISM="Lankesteria abbotti" /LENGTH=157 /DNA_ID=CAMNT_0000816947 /DNA_START=51 /DNA_END=524 /DNA_ORIENTATION=- /assembly_acc=CAM_ASM_000359